MQRHLWWIGFLWVIGSTEYAMARQSYFDDFCNRYPGTDYCSGKSESRQCAVCHTDNPGGSGPLNDYGKCFSSNFTSTADASLAAIETLDCDGDGATNIDELLVYLTEPGDKLSKPQELGAEPLSPAPRDYGFLLRKVSLDFCGHSPSFEAFERLAVLPERDRQAEVHFLLNDCLRSEFWRGKNGVLWELAHTKIGPILGPTGDYNLFVYTQIDNHDTREMLTAKFDVKRTDANVQAGVLRTTYEATTESVFHKDAVPSANNPIANLTYFIPAEERSGLLTTNFMAAAYTMFAAMPRSAAAQAYRAYLGLDISLGQGTNYVPADLSSYQDYDATNIKEEGCNTCHTVLDPATYPFTRYNGYSTAVDSEGLKAELLPNRQEQENNPQLKRVRALLLAFLLKNQRPGQEEEDLFSSKNRKDLVELLQRFDKEVGEQLDEEERRLTQDIIEKYALIPFTANKNRPYLMTKAATNRPPSPNVVAIPEAGYVLGKPVRDIFEWGRVASDSREFAASRVKDYWLRLVGREPKPSEKEEFDALVEYLMTDASYGIDSMLHKLVETEAYSVR